MNTKKKRLGALDICILVAVVLCLAGVIGRTLLRDRSVLAQNTTLDKYTVYFSISDIRSTSEKFLKDGRVFYIDETGDMFGTLVGDPAVTYAKKLYVDANGKTVEVFNNTEEEGIARIDVEGAFQVSAQMDENGFILLNGNRYIAPHQEIEIRSRELYVNICIHSIEKLS